MLYGGILGWLENFSNNGHQNLFFCKVFFIKVQLEHGIIIRTGITCKKIPCYMRDSACRWFIVKKPKIFQSYVKQF